MTREEKKAEIELLLKKAAILNKRLERIDKIRAYALSQAMRLWIDIMNIQAQPTYKAGTPEHNCAPIVGEQGEEVVVSKNKLYTLPKSNS